MTKSNQTSNKNKIHPWRLCPVGEHWVTTHPMHTPKGSITTRHGHCANNPSGKDQLYPSEMKELAGEYFAHVEKKPCPSNLGIKKDGNKYDDLIAGWTQYWNEVLKPEISLDPNIVKALIGSESEFDPNVLAKKNDQNSARGLMQVNNQARKTLGNENGEIKDHYVTVTRKELNDPNLNICAGIRWLFQKQKLSSHSLGHEASWIETIEYFKGLKNKTEAEKTRIMKKFYKFKNELEKCQK